MNTPTQRPVDQTVFDQSRMVMQDSVRIQEAPTLKAWLKLQTLGRMPLARTAVYQLAPARSKAQFRLLAYAATSDRRFCS